ncbi:MAG TPA: helix-turn-helix domain-containing protein [Thermomicrobiales bacterium]|nr:helix-turn-helix domain-containing protein [Thermomicrobiales bacterium]
MASTYRVILSDDERAELHTRISAGVAPARELTRARILLKADRSDAGPAWSDAMIAGALEVHPSTVSRVRRQCVDQGLEATLARKSPDRLSPRTLDGEQEAHLVAMTCSTPPTGCARWSLRLLAEELIRLEVVETISHETVRQVLKKTS